MGAVALQPKLAEGATLFRPTLAMDGHKNLVYFLSSKSSF
jgi:hypothetical protein